jgi:hypothetical protein
MCGGRRRSGVEGGEHLHGWESKKIYYARSRVEVEYIYFFGRPTLIFLLLKPDKGAARCGLEKIN